MRFTIITLLAATTSTLAATVPNSCFWCVSTGQFWESAGKLCKNAKSATTLTSQLNAQPPINLSQKVRRSIHILMAASKVILGRRPERKI